MKKSVGAVYAVIGMVWLLVGAGDLLSADETGLDGRRGSPR
jgi:hypothetical protein